MMNKVDISNKLLLCVFMLSFILAGCTTTGGQKSTHKAGPKSSSSYTEKVVAVVAAQPKLDVIIPIFDPGLAEHEGNYADEGIWPELRRAEANRFAYKLKQALDNSNMFGAVRVTPDETASGDIYVLGKINESNGQEVEFDLNIVDIAGKEWFDDSFEHEVLESFYNDIRNENKDPYAPAFKEAADDIIKALQKRNATELENLKTIADLRFGASFNDAAFMEYMDSEGKYIKLVSQPSDNDPLLQRVIAIRVREQLFIDNLQQNYASFSQNMDESYLKWQQASFTETKLQQEAKNEGIFKAVGGAVLIGLAIAAAAASGDSELADAGLDTAAILGGIGGVYLLSSGFKSKEEAKLHQDAINEIGESINIELAPQVVSFENETVELTGNVQQQFAQWREFLNRIYQQETTPNTAL
ncbi:hypothetical protein A9Q78_09785 [Methylophaga sp. 41_12_T18]|nr:hypothetical protein A9Q78_09785 [Methylophaga sp. 41_12_T18]